MWLLYSNEAKAGRNSGNYIGWDGCIHVWESILFWADKSFVIRAIYKLRDILIKPRKKRKNPINENTIYAV